MNSPSANQRHRSLKVALLSLNQRTQAVLEFFFLSTGRSLFVQSSEDAAEVVIFDADNPESRQHWERHHAQYRRPAIMLSVAHHELPDTFWLQKPFTPASLLAAGNQILAGGVTTPAVVPPPPAVVPAKAEAATRAEVVAAPASASPVMAPAVVSKAVPPDEPAPVREPAVEPLEKPASAPSAGTGAAVGEPPVRRSVVQPASAAEKSAVPSEQAQPRGAMAKAFGFLSRFLGRADGRQYPPPAAAQELAKEVAAAAPSVPLDTRPSALPVADGAAAAQPESAVSADPVKVEAEAVTAPPQVSAPVAIEPVAVAPAVVEAAPSATPVGARFDPDFAIDTARYCGDAPDAALVSPTATPALYYQPEQYLFFLLREANQIAHKWRVPTEIEVDGNKMLVVPAENRIYISFERELLSQLATRPLARRVKPRVVSVNEFNQLKQSLSSGGCLERIDAVLWETCMEAAKGRLPVGTEVDKTLYLRHWPNFTRLLRAPHAMRIAALWATRGAGLMETAQMLRVEQKYVFAFFNAASALDLVTVDGSHLSKFELHRKSPQDRGLLGRLFGWLKGKH